jgi:hypothetical protein
MKIMNFHHPLIILMPVPQSPETETLRGRREHVLALLDAFLRDVRTKKAYA